MITWHIKSKSVKIWGRQQDDHITKAVTIIIAVPTRIKIFSWIIALIRRNLHISLPKVKKRLNIQPDFAKPLVRSYNQLTEVQKSNLSLLSLIPGSGQ